MQVGICTGIGLISAEVTSSDSFQSIEYLPLSVKYATQLLWKTKNGHII